MPGSAKVDFNMILDSKVIVIRIFFQYFRVGVFQSREWRVKCWSSSGAFQYQYCGMRSELDLQVCGSVHTYCCLAEFDEAFPT